jgi:hypothetical protein
MLRRVPIVLFVAVGLLVLPLAVAAAGPDLQATVIPGKEIDVVGSGFPASADVTLAISRNDVLDETRTVTADVSGAFTATIDAGPGRGGAYTIVATAGDATASADVVAVETAGGTAGGTFATPPPTSTGPQVTPDGAPGERPAMPALAAAALLGITSAAWAMRRSHRAAR